jgi:hypothetical protein
MKNLIKFLLALAVCAITAQASITNVTISAVYPAAAGPTTNATVLLSGSVMIQGIMYGDADTNGTHRIAFFDAPSTNLYISVSGYTNNSYGIASTGTNYVHLYTNFWGVSSNVMWGGPSITNVTASVVLTASGVTNAYPLLMSVPTTAGTAYSFTPPSPGIMLSHGLTMTNSFTNGYVTIIYQRY